MPHSAFKLIHSAIICLPAGVLLEDEPWLTAAAGNMQLHFAIFVAPLAYPPSKLLAVLFQPVVR